jgi:hypothetical protein
MPVQPLEHINCFSATSLDRFAARHGLAWVRLSALRAMQWSLGWHTPSAAVKNVLRPLYRFTFGRGTYRIYRHARPT